MIVLGLETATSVCGVALISQDRVLVQLSTYGRLTHSQRLMPLVDQALGEAGVDRGELDGIAVSAGPGSFTGLRIGLATAKGLGFSLQRPVITVPTLDALAFNVWAWPGLICPLLDARKAQVYAALYRGGSPASGDALKRLGGYWAIGLSPLLDRLSAFDEPVLFLGDALSRYGQGIQDRLNDKARFAPLAQRLPAAAGVAEIGLRLLASGRRPDATQAAPIYIRRSEAEVKAEAGNRAKARARAEAGGDSQLQVDAIDGSR